MRIRKKNSNNKTHTKQEHENRRSKQIRLAKAEEKHYLQEPVTSPQHKPRQQTSTRKKEGKANMK